MSRTVKIGKVVPTKGVDYFTAQDIAEMEDYVINSSTSAFNQNATQKTNQFNSNATSKTEAFNNNANSKTTTFNENATQKTNAFNSNATSKTNDFNSNATAKTEAYDGNASSKLSAYNDNATSKVSAYNSNDTAKTTAYNNNASAKTEAFNDNYEDKIDLFDEHSEELQAELDRYKTLENALPHVNGEGESITLNNTANSPLDLELEPNTTQESYTGANIIPFQIPSTDFTISGVRFYLNDGSLILNGTASAEISSNNENFTNNFTRQYSAGNYKLKTFGQIPSGIRIFLKNYGTNVAEVNSTTSESTFSLAESKYLNVGIYVENGKNISNLDTKLMLTTRDYTGDYEKYIGGASPSPDYPQDIHVISGDNTIDICGKNLLPQDKYITTTTKNGITYTNNGDGTFNLSGTASNNTTIEIIPSGSFQLEANQSYYLYSSVPYNGTTFNMSIPMTDNGTTKFLLANNTYTPTTTPTNVRLQFYIGNGQSVNQTNIKLMLVKGNTAPSTYDSYVSSSYQVNLGDIEFCKINDYKDRFFKNVVEDPDYDATRELGKWYLKKNIDKAVLDGGESWTYYTGTNKSVFYIDTNLLSNKIDYLQKSGLTCYCDYFAGKGQVNTFNDVYDLGNNVIAFRFSYGRLAIRDDRYTDAEDFKIWLSTHNVIVDYVLKNPEYILLNDTLQEQLETIYNKLLSYQEQTNISQENNDLAFNIKAKAVYDLNKLVERVTTLEESQSL